MTKIATETSLKKRRDQREHRKIMLLGYIKLHPEQTTYGLSKQFQLPLSSIHSLLKELEGDLHLKSTITNEHNRTKKKFSIRTFDDFTKTNYVAATLTVPLNLRAAKNALQTGHSIAIELSNGNVVHLHPGDSLEEFLQQHNLQFPITH